LGREINQYFEFCPITLDPGNPYNQVLKVIGGRVGGLVGGLVGWWVGRSVDWSASWLAGWLITGNE
jgi:hypothetical protein